MILEASVKNSYRKRDLAQRRFGDVNSVSPLAQGLIQLNEATSRLDLPHIIPEKLKYRGTLLSEQAKHAHIIHSPESPVPIIKEDEFWRQDLSVSDKEKRNIEVGVHSNSAIKFITDEKEPFTLTLRPTHNTIVQRISGRMPHPVIIDKQKLVVDMGEPTDVSQKKKRVLHAGLESPYDSTTNTVTIGSEASRESETVIEVPRSRYIDGFGRVDVSFPIQFNSKVPMKVTIKPYGLHVKIHIKYDVYGPAWPM